MGSRYVNLIADSIEAKVRPTTMILGEDNRKAWSKMDVLIMQAYGQFKREQCTNCGHPIWICRNEDSALIARKVNVTCWITQEVDEWREKADEKEDAKFIRPEVYSRDGRELHEFRLPYYEAQARAQAEEEAE